MENYFCGFRYIDHLTISTGTARTECQVYNDATLVVYFPFDTIDPLLDRSVNLIHGIASGIKTGTAGRLQQAITFDSNTSYFQALCYPTMRYTGFALSVSLWVNPTAVIGGGSLVHVSVLQTGNGTTCYDILGFTATGVLAAQLLKSGTPPLASIESVVLPLNTWTHVAIVYTTPTVLRLYINGQFIAVTTVSLTLSPTNYYITLGNYSPGLSGPPPCSTLSVVAGAFQGSIDEFRIYNRALDAQELCVLANI